MKHLNETIRESLLDDDILDKYTPEKVSNIVTWQHLTGDRKEHTEEANKIHQYVSASKCKKLTLPNRRGRNWKPINIDENKYYIYFGLSKSMDVRIMAVAKGDEKLYTWNVPIQGPYRTTMTRFVSLIPSKITKDLSIDLKLELYEMPKELVWLYDKAKSEVKNIKESLLDDEVFDRGSKVAMDEYAKEKFVEWVIRPESGWAQSYKHQLKARVNDKIQIDKDGRISTYWDSFSGPYTIREENEPMPDIVKLGSVRTLVFGSKPNWFEKMRDHLPTRAVLVQVCSNFKTFNDFEFETCDFSSSGVSIKNLTLHFPGTRPGLTLNEFNCHLSHVKSESDIKEIMIDGVRNILVDFTGWGYGENITKKVKDDVKVMMKRYPETDVDDLIMTSLKKFFPLDWVNAYWSGIQTIAFSSKLLPKHQYEGVLDTLKSGDFLIYKDKVGKWCVHHRLFRNKTSI